jgi:hypothetical protein
LKLAEVGCQLSEHDCFYVRWGADHSLTSEELSQAESLGFSCIRKVSEPPSDRNAGMKDETLRRSLAGLTGHVPLSSDASC